MIAHRLFELKQSEIEIIFWSQYECCHPCFLRSCTLLAPFSLIVYEMAAVLPLVSVVIACMYVVCFEILEHASKNSSSAVGRGTSCHVQPILGSWFRFPAQANQAFRLSRVSETVKDLSEEDKTLTLADETQTILSANTHSNMISCRIRIFIRTLYQLFPQNRSAETRSSSVFTIGYIRH